MPADSMALSIITGSVKRLIDTHSHIFTEEFSDDLSDVMLRAKEAGVDAFVMPNINLASVPDLIRVTEMYPVNCHPAIGLHPTELNADFRDEMSRLHDMLLQDRSADGSHLFCAIGEIGLDLYWEQESLPEQMEAFETQIGWALECGLPVIIHSRSAMEPLCKVMDRFRNTSLRGVFHCFSGGVADAERLMEYEGFMFGIGGVLTYKKSELPASLPLIPHDRIIVETDCPYLPPVPYRGRRNEPSFMIRTVERVAELWGVSCDEVADITTANATRLFRIQ